MLKAQIQSALKNVLQELNITDIEPTIEKPADMKNGDYSSNVALQVKSQKSKVKIADQNSKVIELNSPREIAEQIKSQMENGRWKVENLDKVEVAGPGFINFWIAKEELLNVILNPVQDLSSSKILKQVQNDKHDNITTKTLQGKNIMVEFGHPNTHKALHIGHLRNLSTGESLIRLFQSQGAEVIRANYQGDVGMHIAKAMYGLLDLTPFKEQLDTVTGIQERVDYLGKAYAAGSQAYENDPAAKEKILDYNYLIYASAQRFQQEKGIPAGSTDYLRFVQGRKGELDKVYKIWKETRQWSLDYYEMMYKRLGVHYDRYYFESECLSGVDMAKEAVKKGVLKESDGAVIFDGKPYGMDTRVFVNSLGLPTYEAKELSLSTKEFSEFGMLDKLIHVVGPEQASFFTITFKAEELLGLQDKQQYHLAYGWVRLKQGKMSSRLGNVITAEQLLNGVKGAIAEILEKSGTRTSDESTAEQIAIAAIKYSFLKVTTTQEIAFDLQESVSAEGNSGPYLQYTFARTQSVIRRGKGEGERVKGVSDLTLNALPFTLEIEEANLLRLLYNFNETVAEAAEKYSPNILCNYLYILAQQFNLFYQKHQILNPTGHPELALPFRSLERRRVSGSNEDNSEMLNQVQHDNTREFRLGLTSAVGNTIKQGLYLLGIQAPEKM